MSTPSIQTLITQAQQVLNLKSSNEIRATLAAILANANVGTPLNPNLTTQQLWDEFYEIVRQPSDDIMSIITDQMMRMVFSPPAPGGAGADKQVIFNDMGVLAGDAGLVYNKTTDALTVAGLVTAGSATITGALTAQGTPVKLTSQTASDCTVFIGPDSPSAARSARIGFITSSTHKNWNLLNNWNTSGSFEIAQNTTVGGSTLSSNSTFRINSDNSFNFLDGAGGTRMTLNSTGLGIGDSPSSLLYVKKSQNADTTLSVNNENSGAAASARLDLQSHANNYLTLQSYGQNYSGNVCGIAAAKLNTILDNALTANSTGLLIGTVSTNPLYFVTANAVKMTLDASGNLAIGVAATGTRRLELKSAGTSNTTFAAHLRDSADTLLFHVRSDGYFNTGQGALSPYSNTTGSAANMFVDSSGFVYRSTSSLKYKTDVKDSIHGLADVLKLRSVTYKSKNGDDTVFGGLIAEEVHAAGLTEFVAYAPDKTPDSINYGNMVALLVSAIKELTARVQTLEAR